MDFYSGSVFNAGNSAGLLAVNQRGQGKTARWEAGDIISASLLERTADGVAKLQTGDGVNFTADSASVTGNVGDTLEFRVIKNDKTLTLQQIERQHKQQAARARGAAHITDEIKTVSKSVTVIGEDDQRRAEEQQEQQRKASEAVAKIQRAQQYMRRNAGKSAVTAIIESGLSIYKISFAALDRVMREAGKNPVEDVPSEEAVASVSQYDARDIRAIAQSLGRYGLPVNAQNVESLRRAYAELSQQPDDRAVEKLLSDGGKGGGPITFAELYKSRFSAPEASARYYGENADVPVEDLTGEVLKFFKQEGIPDTGENREAAKFLLERGIPLDSGNVANAVFLRDTAAFISREAVFDRAARAIALDEDFSGIPINEFADRDYGDRSLKMAETQLKFTAEAAARLSGKDITIDTGPQRESLRSLTERNREAYERFLRYAGIKDDGDIPAQTGRMASLFGKLSQINPLTANVHPGIMGGQIPFTIDGIHEAVMFARAAEGYETFATVPDPRYGDSFANLRPQFAPLLESLGAAATDANTRAAFILSKSEMDVTLENIERVKEIDAKISAITSGLHPMIAAQMIKEGLAPLEMKADEMLAYIRQFKQVYGEDGGEKVARYIMEMDEDKTLDEDTRKGMVAVYRMLHVIQKDGAAALGLAVRQDAPLTLGALMELSKYFARNKRGGDAFDKSVDDAFGSLERIERPGDNIRSILERSGAVRRAFTHTDLTAEAVIDRAVPDKLREWLAGDGKHIPLEDKIFEEPPAQSAPEQTESAVISQIQTFYAAPARLIAQLQGRGIPATAKALRELEKLPRRQSALSEALAHAGSGERIAAVAEAAELFEARSGAGNGGEYRIPVKTKTGVKDLNLYVLNDKALLEDGAKVLLALETDTLGPVRALFTLNGSAANIAVQAETPAARDRLSGNAEALTALLTAAGFDDIRLSFEVKPENKARPAQPAEDSEMTAPGGRVLDVHEYVV
ncbi:MAG: flagellar hook-length control protein FliK [Clostridiales bacterium]|jgi:hypothetical protein|nr:flagellar hook-length control protein FliK [Clostridiales bacterium]